MTETETAMFVVVVERGLLKVRGILATGGGQRHAASGTSGSRELGALDYKMAICARRLSTCPAWPPSPSANPPPRVLPAPAPALSPTPFKAAFPPGKHVQLPKQIRPVTLSQPLIRCPP
jgi:hypothetical protein